MDESKESSFGVGAAGRGFALLEGLLDRIARSLRVWSVGESTRSTILEFMHAQGMFERGCGNVPTVCRNR